MEERKIQERVADTLLEKGSDKIIVRVLGLNLRLTITPLFLATIVRLTKLSVQIEAEDLGQSKAMEVLGKAHKIARPMALAAAHGVLNSTWKSVLFARLLARIFLRKMTPADLHKIYMMILIQAGVKDFFECTVLIAQMNLARPKEKIMAGGSKEEKPSGEPSQA